MIADSKTIKAFPLIAAGSIIFLLFLSVKRPYLFGESNVMALLVLTVAGLIASQYETHFWTLMIGVFFWAGSAAPLAGGMNLFRRTGLPFDRSYTLLGVGVLFVSRLRTNLVLSHCS